MAVSVHHKRVINLRSSVMVYIQPAPSEPRHASAVRSIRPKEPFFASRLPSKRERKLPDLKYEANTQVTHMTTLKADIPELTDTLQVENPTEAPLRLNVDELKVLVRRDLERQGAQSGHAAGKQEPGALAADVGQESIERARRPKCDNDYKPKVGSVEFSGLMKLPFLLRGAIFDKGCKW